MSAYDSELHIHSDVLAWLGLKAAALAWLSSGFQNPQARPKLSVMAGFSSALAQAVAQVQKIQI